MVEMVNGRIRADGPKGPRSPNRATFLGVLGIKLCPTAAGCIEVTLFFCAAHLTGDRSGRRPVVGNAAVRNEPRPAGEPPPTNAATRRARRSRLRAAARPRARRLSPRWRHRRCASSHHLRHDGDVDTPQPGADLVRRTPVYLSIHTGQCL